MSSKSLSFFFEVQNDDKYTGVPSTLRTKNDLDAHGALLDLKRLPGEDGVSYWKRLSSVIPLRGGANQIGMVHGITRELGLEEKTALVIVPSMVGGKTVAPSPFVEITATQLILYSFYIGVDNPANVIDRAIDIFGHGSGYLLEDVVSQIQPSPYFTVAYGPSVSGLERSRGMIPSSSSQTITKELLPSGTYLRLKNRDIIPGTITFSESTVFVKEVSPTIATGLSGTGITFAFSVTSPVLNDGEYYIDYLRGVITLATSTSGYGNCRYICRKFPFRVRWSPISVYSLRDPIYREKVFESESMPNGSTQLGLVSPEGKEIYDRVFSKAPSLWGV